MIEHIWSVLCTSAVIDKDTNNVTLVQVVERVNVAVQPSAGATLPIQMELVTLWGRKDLDQPERGRARFQLLASDNTELGPNYTYDIDLSTYARTRQRIHFANLPLKGSGKVTTQVAPP